MTIHDRVADARARLRAAGIAPDEAELDARLLAQFVLDWDAVSYFSAGFNPETADFAGRYEQLVLRRIAREPFAYIVGRQEFWGLLFEVSPAVLIPRPETEAIVEIAMQRFADPEAPLLVADACTGSACLAVALARERPAARIIATDVSGEALAVARRNVDHHGVTARIACCRTNVLAGVRGPFDLIVANPPYVPAGARHALPIEVRDHEPGLALFAGADGLDVIRQLCVEAPSRLRAGGSLVFEFGIGQADPVSALVSSSGELRLAEIRLDLQRIPRTLVAERR